MRHLAGALLLGASLWAATAAQAQAATTIELTDPSAAGFPHVTFFASVVGADGHRVLVLPPTSFSLTEDGETIAEISLHEEIVGTRALFAINTVEPLRRRDQRGVTRFDQVRQSLVDAWAAWPDSGAPDDLTVVLADQTLASHRPRAAELAAAFETWSPEFGGVEGGYAPLLAALSQAVDPVPTPGMQTAVVFLTPLIDRPNQQALADAVGLAQASGAAIHAVLIGTLQQAGTAEALRLRQAAEATGGTFRVLDPEAGLDDLIGRLTETRTRYAVDYVSPANASGPHSVQLTVETPDLTATSEPASYNLDIQPPQVAFVQPPIRIVRQTDDPNRPLSDIEPTSVDLPLLITFPDGHPRAITGLRFLVNGEAVAERSAPPFDSVTWDLASIVETGGYHLLAEVTDSQGLVAQTAIAPVQVEVIPGPRGLDALRPALTPLVAGLGIVALGVALIAGWFQLGQVEAENGWSEAGPGGMRALRRARLGALASGTAPEAYLVPLHTDGSPGPPIELEGGDLTIGSDASLCGLLLDDPSVSGLQARLTRRAAGSFSLRDQNSIAGTWVNDEPIDDAGRDLHHGDRIFFGRAAYRFRLTTPGPEPRAVVRPARGEAGG